MGKKHAPKVLFLGVRGSGKTALAKRLICNNYEENLDTTLGISIFSHPNRSYGIFDAASLIMHQDFVRGSYPSTQLITFVLDPLQSLDEQQDYFINEYYEIRKVNPNVKFLLAINKSDAGFVSPENLNVLQDEIPFAAVIDCSAKAGKVADLEKNILHFLHLNLEATQSWQKNIELKVIPKNPFEKLLNNLKDLHMQLADGNETMEASKTVDATIKTDISDDESTTSKVNESAVQVESEVVKSKEEYKQVLRHIIDKLSFDVDRGKLSSKKGEAIASSIIELTEKVHQGSVVENDIKNFNDNVAKIEMNSKWRKILAVLAGAALGFIVGAVIGIVSGPGAFVTAATGAAVGATLVASGLSIYSLFRSQEAGRELEKIRLMELGASASRCARPNC